VNAGGVIVVVLVLVLVKSCAALDFGVVNQKNLKLIHLIVAIASKHQDAVETASVTVVSVVPLNGFKTIQIRLRNDFHTFYFFIYHSLYN
jgi:hypothetical protein